MMPFLQTKGVGFLILIEDETTGQKTLQLKARAVMRKPMNSLIIVSNTPLIWHNQFEICTYFRKRKYRDEKLRSCTTWVIYLILLWRGMNKVPNVMWRNREEVLVVIASYGIWTTTLLISQPHLPKLYLKYPLIASLCVVSCSMVNIYLLRNCYKLGFAFRISFGKYPVSGRLISSVQTILLARLQLKIFILIFSHRNYSIPFLSFLFCSFISSPVTSLYKISVNKAEAQHAQC